VSALQLIQQVNASAEFNRWCGIEVTQADTGSVELRLPWRKELGQYSGLLHAGLAATVMETASGFAAATQCGPQVLVTHFSVNCLRPAKGVVFIARARVIKAGKTQTFTQCDLFAVDETGTEKLVANCQAVLAVGATAA
jgi:uncharacterized protein (TIGR00369 family)